MNHPSITRAIAALLALALTLSSTSAQIVDAQVEFGDTFEGHFLSGDTDAVRLEAVAGTVITVVGARTSKKQEIFPVLTVIDLTTETELIEVESLTGRTVIKKLTLPSTGEYEVQTYSFKPDLGGHRLRVTGKPPKDVLSTKEQVTIAAGDSADVVFTAASGWELTLRTPNAKGKAAYAGAPTLVGPSGAVDISEFLTSKNGIKKFSLPELGTYTLTVPNDGTEDGLFTLSTKLKPVRSKETIRERVVTRGELPVTLLGGTVREVGAETPVVGATVVVSNEAGVLLTTTTNAAGQFVFVEPPTGEVVVDVDGSTASGTFDDLNFAVDVAPLSTTITRDVALVDPTSSANAAGSVGVSGGATNEVMNILYSAEFSFSLPGSTPITLDAAPFVGTLEVNLAPVDASDVPAAPPEGQRIVSALRLFPDGATFGDGDGTVLRLPDPLDVDAGHTISLWHYDPLDEAWTDLSELTSTTGVTDKGGSEPALAFSDAVTRGGYLAATIPTVANCGAAIEASFPLPEDTYFGIEGMRMTAATGDSALTDFSGTATLTDIAVRDPSLGVDCTQALPLLELTFTMPPGFTDPPVRYGVPVDAGGSLAFATPSADLPSCLAVFIEKDGLGVDGTLEIVSADSDVTEPVVDGRVFVPDMEPGTYELSFTFEGDSDPTTVMVEARAGVLTTARIAPRVGDGFSSFLARVVFDDLTTATPVGEAAGADVILYGTDASSKKGLVGSTNCAGQVLFAGVEGPFDITASLDVETGSIAPVRTRVATSLVTIYHGVATMPLVMTSPVEAIALDEMLSGQLTGLPSLGVGDAIHVEVRDEATRGAQFLASDFVDPLDGLYSLAVPSDIDLVVTVIIRDDSLGPGNPGPTRGIAPLGVIQVPQGELVVLDATIDSNSYIPFTEDVSLTLPATENESVRILWIRVYDGETRLVTSLPAFYSSDGATPPTSVGLPDLGLAALGDHALSLEWELIGSDGMTRTCVAPISEPLGAVAFTDSPLVTFDSVQDGGALKTKSLVTKGLSVADPDETSDHMLRTLELKSVGDTGLAGIDDVHWRVFVPQGMTTSRFPASAVPILVSGSDYELTTTKAVYAGTEVYFFAFFVAWDDHVAKLASSDVCTATHTIDVKLK